MLGVELTFHFRYAHYVAEHTFHSFPRYRKCRPKSGTSIHCSRSVIRGVCFRLLHLRPLREKSIHPRAILVLITFALVILLRSFAVTCLSLTPCEDCLRLLDF
jgi:hypothetical protein